MSGRDVEEVATSSKERAFEPTGSDDVFPDGGTKAWLCVLGVRALRNAIIRMNLTDTTAQSFLLSAVCCASLGTFLAEI